jgi:ketosteroid isomerase-like protein
LEQRDYEKAAEAFLRYAQMVPDQPRPYDSLGLLYLRQGLLDEAEEQFEAALKRDPGFADSQQNLSRVQVERCRRRLEAAVLSRDVDEIATLFTGAAQVVLPEVTALAGGGSIAGYWENTFSGEGVELHTAELHLGIEGDVATEVGRYRIASGADETIDGGQYLTVWVLTIEGWKIHRSIWTSDR